MHETLALVTPNPNPNPSLTPGSDMLNSLLTLTLALVFASSCIYHHDPYREFEPELSTDQCR